MILNSISFAQPTWNRVGQDNNFAISHQGVKFYNDTINTCGLSIYYGDSIPYVTLEQFKYDLDGNLLSDTRLGNMDTTYVVGNRINFTNNTFCNYGEIRYPNQPTKPYNQFAYFIDLTNNKHFKYINVLDTIYYSYIKNAIKFNENKYCFLFANQPVNETASIVCSVIIIDSLKNVLHEKSFYTSGYWLLPREMYQFENYYYLFLNKQLINMVNNPSDLIIYKMDSLFNMVDSFKTNSQNWYGGYTTQPLSNGDFIVGGVYSDGMQGNYVWQKKYLRKFDKNFNIIWTKYFGKRSFNTGINKLIISNDGNIIGCGIDGIVTTTVNGDSIGHITGCIFKYSLNGDSLWMRNYQALDDPLYSDENLLLDIDEMPDGGFIASGKALADLPTRRRGWIIRLDSNGCLTTDCVSNTKEIEASNEFIVYPNPGEEILNITNSNQISSYQIFQFDGKLVERGTSFPLNIIEYAQGFYFLQIRTKSNQVFNYKIIKK
jgi:hypothetical protein